MFSETGLIPRSAVRLVQNLPPARDGMDHPASSRMVSSWNGKATTDEYVGRSDLEINRTAYLGCQAAVN